MKANPLTAGHKAPNFSLPDQDGDMIQLSDFKGQYVLLYFYPKAMTPGCTVQACNLRDSLEDFKEWNITILGVSADPIEKLSKFCDRDLLNFNLLSDMDHTVCEAYGVWGEKLFMGKTFDGIHRVTFLIDGKGKIEHVFDNFKTNNHHKIILDYLQNK